jgi:hypothetical protein
MSTISRARRLKVPRPDPKKWSMSQHISKCMICNSPSRDDIETDYTHCIPWSDINRRYGTNDHSIEKHSRAFDLHKKRDRNLFYWKMIEKFDYNKVTAENAI